MNGYDSADLPTGVAVNSEGFLAVHAGTFYTERSPEHLFRALSILRTRNSILSRQLKVELYGPRDERTLHLIETMHLGDIVQYRGYVPHSEVLRRLAAANLLLLVVHNNDVGRIAIPAKVFEYLALLRPVLAIAPLDAEVAELLQGSASNSVVAFDDVEGIVNAIERAYAQFVRGELVRRDETFLERFERSKLTQKLAEVFDEVTGKVTTSAADQRFLRRRGVER
jgi:glycosyltransferase involved in cell wall biosynthesis